VAAVVVIGGGLSGLAAAARLARQRHDVTLLDARTPGERAVAAEEPASFTLPAVYRDLFGKTGRSLEYAVRLVPVDPARRYLIPDGRVLDLPTGNRAAMLDAFGRGLGAAAASEWDSLVTWGGARWAGLRHQLVPDGEAPRPTEAIPPRVRVRNPANQLVLDWYAIDAGVDPSRSPADLAVVPYLEQAFGAWQVEGGLPALAAATAQRARRCAAALQGGTEVVEVLVRDGNVTGVRTADGSTVGAEVVVDTVGLPAGTGRPGRVRAHGPAIVTVRIRSAEVPDLPVETVLLPRGGAGGIVVARPDVTADPGGVLVHARVPAAPGAGDEAAVVRELLATLSRAGVHLPGEIVDRSVRPVRPTARTRWWPRRETPAWLDLRDRLTVRDVEGLLGAVPRVSGGLSVPWQGLVAALAAGGCGTVPRRAPG